MIALRRAFVAALLVLVWPAVVLSHHAHSASGPLVVLKATDRKGGVTRVFYRVGDTPVTFKANPPVGLAPGTFVEVRGEPTGKALAADGKDLRVLTTAAAPAAPSGVQRTVALIVNLKDRTAKLTQADVQRILFGSTSSVDALYREASFGKVSLAGDVFGPFTIALDSTLKDDWEWAYAADRAAVAAGVNFANYTRRVYVMPDADLGYGGLGTIGGTPSRSWIYDDEPETFAHELGHNLGLQHASTPTAEYGDDSCIMGSPSGLVHPNGPHKVALGWVPSSNVETVTTSGTRVIANLEEQRPAIQVLELAKPDTGEAYYLSYRRAIGFDGTNLSWRYRDRTSIHRFVKGEKSYLLASLADGESWKDDANGITVTQSAHDAIQATVSITFGKVAPASLSVTTGTAVAGSTTEVTISVRNADPVGSPLAAFDLTAALPAGWTGTVTPASLALQPGATGAAKLRVQVPATAKPAAYAVSVTANDKLVPGHRATATASFTVTAPPPPPPATVPALRAARVTATTLNVREAPTTASTVLGTVPNGHVFVRTGVEKDGFAEVAWAGRKAWVSLAYLAGTTAAGGRVTTAGLNVRSGPSTSDPVIGTLGTGDVYADAPGGTTGWRAIHWDGKRTAYVSRLYTTDVSLAP